MKILPLATGRACGDCTLCCKVMGVKELDKAKNVWCVHCHVNRGCRIYEDRPASCRDFNCLWLQGAGPEAMKPSRSRVVFTMQEVSLGTFLVAHVDESRPDALRNGSPTARYVERYIERGGHVVQIVAGRDWTIWTKSAELAAKFQEVFGQDAFESSEVSDISTIFRGR